MNSVLPFSGKMFPGCSARRRRAPACLIMLILALAGMNPCSAQTRHDTFIPVGAGDSLDATYYVPSAAPPASGYPALIFVHGFGEDKTVDTANCAVYARMGFLTLAFSVRGHGSSSGLSMIMAAPERADLQPVLRFVKALPGVDSAAVGIVGGSQGGLHGLWAAADRLDIRAISADVIVPDWASDLFRNGSIRRLLLFLLKADSVRYDAERDSLWELVRRDAFDELKSRFVSGRDVGGGMLDSSSVPLLFFLKWQDHYFEATDGLAFFARYQGPRKLYLGTVGHFSDPSTVEQARQSDFVTRWMRHYLMGEENGITAEKEVAFAESTLPMAGGYWTWQQGSDLDRWPPDGTALQSFYFSPDSSLTLVPPTLPEDSVEVSNLYHDTTYTFDKGFIEGFKGSSFDFALPTVSRRFIGAPLPSAALWAGVPVLSLDIRADAALFPLHARISEIDSLGGVHFINRVNFTARHWSPGARDTVEVHGIPHAHLFSRGSRVMVELTNIDRDPADRPEIGEQAFVTPVFATARPQVFLGGSRPSRLALPLVSGPSDLVADNARAPVRTSLQANYPNPFNPSTTLAFTLAARSYVSLKVYNLLGQELAELCGKELAPGSYTLRWNAGQSPTGVYVAVLQAGDKGRDAGTRQVMKMMLLK